MWKNNMNIVNYYDHNWLHVHIQEWFCDENVGDMWGMKKMCAGIQNVYKNV